MSASTPLTVRALAVYFLRLGAVGFGGPVALAERIRHDLVEQRGWIAEAEYEAGLAIAAACPGPLAYQLAVYCGFVRRGVSGALAVAFAFALAPFVIVLATAALYVRLATTWPLRAVFYGAGPVVLTLILRAAWKLGTRTLRRDAAAWVIAVLAGAVTAGADRRLLGRRSRRPSVLSSASAREPTIPPTASGPVAGALAVVFPLATPTVAAARLFVFFFKTGLLVFGSGLVIVPFLKAYVVDQYGWLGEREFLDAVAVGMISPGPVVITATFVGYVVGGVAGAVAATAGMFAPAVLFTVLATPLLLRWGRSARFRGLTRGITVTVVGVLAGTTALVARSVVGDALTATLLIASSLALLRWPRLPDPLLVAAGAAVGLAGYRWLQPGWILR